MLIRANAVDASVIRSDLCIIGGDAAVEEKRRFDALFRNLPAPSVVVSNDYLVDSMVRYKLLGEGAAGQRDIRGPVRPEPGTLRQLARSGFSVFAFAQQLRLNGFRFAEAPLFESISRHLDFVPNGTIVAIASSHAANLLLTEQTLLRIAGHRGRPSGLTSGVIVGVVDAKGQPLEQWGTEHLQLNVAVGAEIGTTGTALPIPVMVSADPVISRIAWGEGHRLETSDGAVIVGLNPDGTLRETQVVDRYTRNGVPLDQRNQGFGVAHIGDLSLFRLLEPGRCETIRPNEWTDVGSFARAGKLSASLSGSASLKIYVGRQDPLGPSLTFTTKDSGLTLDAQLIGSGDEERATIRDALAGVAVDNAAALSDSAYVYSLMVESTVSGETAADFALVFGGVPDFAVAYRGTPVGDEGSCRVCTATLGYDGLLGDPARKAEPIDWTRTGHDEMLGVGWSGRSPKPTRWAATTAELLLPLWRRDPLRLSIEARPDDGPQAPPNMAPNTMELIVNGKPRGRQAIRRGWRRYEWELPSSILSAGLNQAFLHIRSPRDSNGPDGPRRQQAIEVREITMTRQD